MYGKSRDGSSAYSDPGYVNGVVGAASVTACGSTEHVEEGVYRRQMGIVAKLRTPHLNGRRLSLGRRRIKLVPLFLTVEFLPWLA